ncbi:MAG: hypothetical protein M3X11_17835, partial [Acidobacteriota bacterium]|nr:hypothetical protein [Acidobacteriota bacterium]
LAIIIGSADLTALFIATGNTLKYTPQPLPLPTGENELTVYLVAPNGQWKAVASFVLKVTAKAEAAARILAETVQPAEGEQAAQAPTADAASATTPVQAEPVKRRFGFDKFQVTPSLNIGVKSQFAETHFPDTNRPERPTFADATVQGTWKSEMARGSMQMQQQFDIIGSGFRNEALRFADLRGEAPKVDLASYLMQFQQGTRKFNLGHASFGAHRHLINNFSSRGLTVSLPITNRLDVSLAAINSTNIVGYDNFAGVNNPRHRMFSGILGFEVFAARPGGLRFETGIADAWFLANRQNFTQGNINDSERSRGLSFRVFAKDKSERIRLDSGFTRSQFVNPNDPLLNQNAVNIVQSRQTTRSARYADVSVDLLKGFSFVKTKPAIAPNADAAANQQTQDAQAVQPVADPKKLNLTLNVRHERIDPLFRSIGAGAQADLQQNVVELVGAFGELNFTAAHTQFNDNLAGIRTILRTDTRRTTFAINSPLQGLFSLRPQPQPNPFLPRIGYAFEHTRAFADFIPVGGGFDQPGAIPDQSNINQTFTAEWQVKELSLTYRLNHTLQDNRAVGRERADLQNFVHSAAVGWNPLATLQLSFETSFEDANNREQANTARTLRFGFTANWQATPRQGLNATFSTLGAGDLLRTNKNRNAEFDFQWNYKLTRQNENRFKKVQTVYFIRYSNRFAHTRNFTENVNTLTRLNTFNTGLNFIFF